MKLGHMRRLTAGIVLISFALVVLCLVVKSKIDADSAESCSVRNIDISLPAFRTDKRLIFVNESCAYGFGAGSTTYRLFIATPKDGLPHLVFDISTPRQPIITWVNRKNVTIYIESIGVIATSKHALEDINFNYKVAFPITARGHAQDMLHYKERLTRAIENGEATFGTGTKQEDIAKLNKVISQDEVSFLPFAKWQNDNDVAVGRSQEGQK